MSLYAYGLPVNTQEYRGRTAGHAVFAGIEHQNAIQCHGGCGERKPQAGGTKRNGKFICADCKKPKKTNWFSAMVTGQIAIPSIPKRGIRTHKIGMDEAGQAAVRAENERAVFAAINAGYYTGPQICAVAEISPTTLKNITTPLLKSGALVKVRKGHQIHYRTPC